MTADALTWDEVAVVVEMAARNGVHTPGTGYEWRHGYIPLTPGAATSHGHGKVPKGWHAPKAATANHGKAVAPPKAAAEDKSMAMHRLAQINERLMHHKRPDKRIGVVAHQLSAHLSNAGKPGYDMATVKTLLSSLEHLISAKGTTAHDGQLASMVGSLRDEIAGMEYARSPEGRTVQAANSWDDLAAVIDLAATLAKPPAGRLTVASAGNGRLANRAGPVGANPPAGAPRPKSVRPRLTPLTPMREATAKSMTKLAEDMKASHPEMSAHQHLRDAARTLRTGNEEQAQRHLRAAMFSLSPQSLMRHGLHTDDAHIEARQAMHSVHRHLLLVKDIVDVGEKNRAAIERHAEANDTASPPLPASPARPDPNAGYGPGALAQKPAARQPGGDQALNAPARTNSGGSDPAVADPVGPQPKGSKQFTGGEHAAIGLARRAGTGKHLVAGRMPKAELAQHLAQFHQRPAGDQTAKALQARHTVLHRVMDATGGPGIPHDHGSVPEAAGVTSFARTWGEVEALVVDLSAKTGALSVTPAPYGKPGGPGLYGVAGQRHSAYFEQVVKALMEKRGMDKGRASAIAYGALRKWARGGGKVHSEVRAAAGGALAEEAAKHGGHSHAATWDDLGTRIDLAAAAPAQPASQSQQAQSRQAQSQQAQSQARVPAGQPGGGEFAPGQTGAAPTDAKPVGSGATGKPVSDLQARLNALGIKPPLKPDGKFGPATLAAVRSFQKAHGLKVDGLVGPLTTAALRGKPAAKKAAAKR